MSLRLFRDRFSRRLGRSAQNCYNLIRELERTGINGNYEWAEQTVTEALQNLSRYHGGDKTPPKHYRELQSRLFAAASRWRIDLG